MQFLHWAALLKVPYNGLNIFFFIITYLMSGDIRKCTLNVKIYQKYQENTVAKNVSLKMISSNCATFYGQGEFWLIFLPLLLLLPHFINNGTKFFLKLLSIFKSSVIWFVKNCCLKPSKGFEPQIELQPTRCQYLLINYPAKKLWSHCGSSQQ